MRRLLVAVYDAIAVAAYNAYRARRRERDFRREIPAVGGSAPVPGLPATVLGHRAVRGIAALGAVGVIFAAGAWFEDYRSDAELEAEEETAEARASAYGLAYNDAYTEELRSRGIVGESADFLDVVNAAKAHPPRLAETVKLQANMRQAQGEAQALEEQID